MIFLYRLVIASFLTVAYLNVSHVFSYYWTWDLRPRKSVCSEWDHRLMMYVATYVRLWFSNMSDAIFLAQIHIPIVLPILVSDMRTWSLLDISSFLSYLAQKMKLFTCAFLAQAIFASRPFKVDIPVSFWTKFDLSFFRLTTINVTQCLTLKNAVSFILKAPSMLSMAARFTLQTLFTFFCRSRIKKTLYTVGVSWVTLIESVRDHQLTTW